MPRSGHVSLAEADDQLTGLVEDARELQPRTVALRRAVHCRPEQGLHLPETQATILAELDDLPLRVHVGRSLTSVVGVIDGDRPGPTVLLRGDMDALPLAEDTGLAFASTITDTMHACGHDMHVAMLATAARVLAARRDQLVGRVLLMFQPGEEGYHGARHMIDEGLLDADGPAGSPEWAFALHISATMPSGQVRTRAGSIMAAADVLRVTVTGRGGHASAPHDATDPIPAAAAIVGALQTMITRRVDVMDPSVLTIAHIKAGSTSNVIPETAFMEGTLRTLSETVRAKVLKETRAVCAHTAAAYGCSAAIEIEPGYSVTVNDTDAAERIGRLATTVLGPDASTVMHTPIMGAEDFSYVLSRVPGALAFVGGCPPDRDPDTAPPNHSNRVVFDEDAMPHGVAMYAALALDTLRG